MHATNKFDPIWSPFCNVTKRHSNMFSTNVIHHQLSSSASIAQNSCEHFFLIHSCMPVDRFLEGYVLN